MALLQMFSYPFMQRAFLAGAMLAVLLAGLGIFVTLRRMAFFGDGIAHSSLAGIAIAVLAGLAPLPVALVWAVIVALFIFWFERSTKLASDTLIGIFFTASMALGVVLMSFTHGYQPELVSYLFGSILSIQAGDLAIIACLTLAIGGWLIAASRSLIYMSLAPEPAEVAGVPVNRNTLILYVGLAAATVLGVKILGIILISALLVLPSAAGLMLTSSFRGYLFLSLLIAEVMMFAGLALSFLYDLPSGATVILLGTALFFLAAAARAVSGRAALAAARR